MATLTMTTMGLCVLAASPLSQADLMMVQTEDGSSNGATIPLAAIEPESFFSRLHPEQWFSDAQTPPPLKNFDGEPRIFNREAILADQMERISPDFRIPEGLQKRVGFWFDVYTKYDSNQRVIHLSTHPWVIFKVVDVSSIINADQPRRRWMRNEKADKHVKAEAQKIRNALRALSRVGAKPRNEVEEQVAQALSELGGNLHRNARKAAQDVRVQMGQKEHFTSALRISRRYMKGMEEIFESHRLPKELARIPFVESSFEKKATSKVGASGIWQFMNGTGKKFMRVDDFIDERRSPYKATEGAARLLKENHLILHRSWPLAVTAWNHGPPGVRRAIRATGSKDISVIVSKYRSKSFDFASSNFYSEFLAALHAERYSEEIFGSLIREEELLVDLIRVPKRVPIKKVIEITGLSNEEFFRINPDLSERTRRRGFIPAGYRMHVPHVARAAIEELFFLKPTAARVDNN